MRRTWARLVALLAAMAVGGCTGMEDDECGGGGSTCNPCDDVHHKGSRGHNEAKPTVPWPR